MMKKILTLTITLPLFLIGQAPVNPLKDFLEKRIASGGSSAPNENVQMAEQAVKYDKATVLDAMPTIMKALKSDAEHVSLDAGLILVSMSRRPDSGELLRPYHRDLLALLDRPDIRYTAVAIRVFVTERPTPLDVAPSLSQFVLNDSKPKEKKPEVTYGLIRIDPTLPETVAAMRHVLTIPLPPEKHIAALNIVGGSQTSDKAVTALVAKGLADEDEVVRGTAIQTLQRLGPAVVAEHSAALQKIASNAKENQQLRDRANAALTNTRYIPPRPGPTSDYGPTPHKL